MTWHKDGGPEPATNGMDGAVGGWGSRYLDDASTDGLDIEYVVIDLAEANGDYDEADPYRYAIEIVSRTFKTDDENADDYDYEGYAFGFETFERADEVAKGFASADEAWKLNPIGTP